MAEFNSVVTTENGLKLIALSAGMTKPLTFTKVVIGSGRPAEGDDITKYTAVKTPKLTCSVSKICPVTDETDAARWSVYSAFSNDAVDDGFYMEEIGLYAKVTAADYSESGWDGYAGEEVLFGYAYAIKDKADWLPDKSTPLDVMEWIFYATVGNASSVTAIIPPETYALAEDLTTHITDPDAHPDIFIKYAKVTDLSAHIEDTDAHPDIFAKYLKTADLTPVKLYDVLHSKGSNFVPSDVTNRGWGSLGTFISSYNQYKLKNQPTQYGQLINICADDNLESTQLWIEQNSGILYFRGGNASMVMNDRTFTKVATYPELESAQSTLQTAINNVSAKAGIIAGDISNVNAWWVKLGGTIPLIIQGGTMYVNRIDDGCNYTLTFPVSFNALPTVSSNINYEGRISGTANVYNGTPSNTSVTFYGEASDDAMWGASINWIAIGKA